MELAIFPPSWKVEVNKKMTIIFGDFCFLKTGLVISAANHSFCPGREGKDLQGLLCPPKRAPFKGIQPVFRSFLEKLVFVILNT
jgi:hypothetical protein